MLNNNLYKCLKVHRFKLFNWKSLSWNRIWTQEFCRLLCEKLFQKQFRSKLQKPIPTLGNMKNTYSILSWISWNKVLSHLYIRNILSINDSEKMPNINFSKFIWDFISSMKSILIKLKTQDKTWNFSKVLKSLVFLSFYNS